MKILNSVKHRSSIVSFIDNFVSSLAVFAQVSLHVIRRKLFSKKLIEKSRECHNHKLQPSPDTKRKYSFEEVYRRLYGRKFRFTMGK